MHANKALNQHRIKWYVDKMFHKKTLEKSQHSKNTGASITQTDNL